MINSVVSLIYTLQRQYCAIWVRTCSTMPPIGIRNAKLLCHNAAGSAPPGAAQRKLGGRAPGPAIGRGAARGQPPGSWLGRAQRQPRDCEWGEGCQTGLHPLEGVDLAQD